MIKYFNELDNRNNYYLPLVARDNGKKELMIIIFLYHLLKNIIMFLKLQNH